MKNRRITLHVFLVLLAVSVAAVWTTRSHANSLPIEVGLGTPKSVQGGEQPNTGEPDGGQIKPPQKPMGSDSRRIGAGLTGFDWLQVTWLYWRAVVGGRLVP